MLTTSIWTIVLSTQQKENDSAEKIKISRFGQLDSSDSCTGCQSNQFGSALKGEKIYE